MNEPTPEAVPAQGLAKVTDRRKRRRWKVPYGVYRKARRATSDRASSKEMRFYRRFLAREQRAERDAERRHENVIGRMTEKQWKRRQRRTGAKRR